LIQHLLSRRNETAKHFIFAARTAVKLFWASFNRHTLMRLPVVSAMNTTTMLISVGTRRPQSARQAQSIFVRCVPAWNPMNRVIARNAECRWSEIRLGLHRQQTKLFYTCPMHPDVQQDHPGNCPKCGMALGPKTMSAAEEENPELADMTRRFWIGGALALPVFFWQWRT
jgi:hypothetical protein